MTTFKQRMWWVWRRREGRRTGFSPLMLRILAVNVMALAILVGSILYLGRYQERLIAAEIDALLLQARLSASALGEGAVVVDEDDQSILSPLLSRLMIRRLVEAAGTRTRLFDLDNTLLADSRILLEHSGQVERTTLPPLSGGFWGTRAAMALFDGLDSLLERQKFEVYDDETAQRGDQYEIVTKALDGGAANQVWRLPGGGLLIAVAVPVQRYKQVLGAVMLSRPDTKVSASIRSVRLNILEIFSITLMITVLLSFYLARAIARPLRLLSLAAEKLHHGQEQNVGLAGTAKLLTPDAIPDFSHRHDEIGDLSIALRDMTGALAQRISAIENFAADVAHEIKNPLTSLRSAVETAERVQDPGQQRKLMMVIRDDVDRLDRLISDISNASRLDAELSRDEVEPIDVTRMMNTLIDIYHVGDDEEAKPDVVRVVLEPLPEGPLALMGVEGRLVQVMQNLISNALSFSPPGGSVRVSVRREKGQILFAVEDDGPGFPENKAAALFDRFYTERPKKEKFGRHSGLGLSISKQIVEAHRGKIWAENRKDADGRVLGARFSVALPG